MPLYCFVIEQLVPYIHFLGTKQTVPAKKPQVCALFDTVLKQKHASATNKALILRCFPGTICCVPINVLFSTGCSILTHYNDT